MSQTFGFIEPPGAAAENLTVQGLAPVLLVEVFRPRRVPRALIVTDESEISTLSAARPHGAVRLESGEAIFPLNALWWRCEDGPSEGDLKRRQR